MLSIKKRIFNKSKCAKQSKCGGTHQVEAAFAQACAMKLKSMESYTLPKPLLLSRMSSQETVC